MSDTMQQQQQQQQPRQPLRRAVYVHVSDLTNAYNIDHYKLEQELERVKESNKDDLSAQERDIDVAQAGAGDTDSVVSVPQQQKRLHAPRAGFNLCVLVGTVKVVVDKLRVDRSRVLLAEVEVGDETGVVSLRARDEQIEALQKVSKQKGAVVLRNCSVELFQGKHIRIAVTKWGKLTPYPDQVASTPPPPSKMNRDRNFSLIDLSLVASELVDMSPSEAAFSPQSQYRAVENTGAGRSSRPQSSRQQLYQQKQEARQTRKPTQNRRQQRQGKSSGSNPPRAAHYPESSIPGHMGSMRYSGMPGFAPSFGEGMEVSHYPYAPPSDHRSQESRSHQASTQQLLMQQYEMHQRQLQQMQAFHEQQERNREFLQAQQGHQPMLMSNMGASASFDTTGDYSVPSTMAGAGAHQSMHLISSNPMLMRVNMAAGHVPPMGQAGQPLPDHYDTTGASPGTPEAFRPYHQTDPSEAAQSFVSPAHGGGSYADRAAEGSAPQSWAKAASSGLVGSNDDSPPTPGHMNAQATSFAPSGSNEPPGEQQHMQSPGYGYVPYDPSAASTMYSPAHSPHAVYNQNVMYIPVAGGTSGAATPSEFSSVARDAAVASQSSSETKEADKRTESSAS